VPLADALGVVRLVVAAALPGTLLRPTRWWLPILLFALAAASDWLDGPLARRGPGPTRHGAVLDNTADIAFVLAGTVTGALLGLVSPAVPLAIAVAFAAYVVASLAQSTRRGAWRLARSRLGHAAGVLNYALTGLIVARTALPGRAWGSLLALASLVVVAANLAAVLERTVPALLTRARAPRGGGSRARSARS
jgi:phosphatidylglycerophosphate synthase